MERVTPGFYRHYKGPAYRVIGVGILDQDGHGDMSAPRQVIYESEQSMKTGVLNLRSEADFVAEVEWPDGQRRPRFVRITDIVAALQRPSTSTHDQKDAWADWDKSDIQIEFGPWPGKPSTR